METPEAPETAASTSTATAETAGAPQPARRVMEEKMPPALWVRILVYTVGCHVMAFFLYLLFLLGDKG